MSDQSTGDDRPEFNGVPPVVRATPSGRLRALAKNLAAPSPSTSAVNGTRSRKQIVNGLDQREVLIGIGVTVIALLFALIGYHTVLHDSSKTVRSEASVFLIAALIGVGLCALGTVLRRRALLGFACFMVGLEFLNYKLLLEAVLYLAVGGWLIFRVTQKRKDERAAGVPPRSREPRPTRQAAAPTAPRASKRYTPPKHNAAGRRR